MTDILVGAGWTIASYFLGMISFGDIVARAAGADIRSLGTKNPGAANMFREVGAKYGAAVFVLDVAKGAVATVPLLLIDTTEWAVLTAAFAVVFGHIYPVLGQRSGGTGMATAIGATIGLAPFGLLAGIPAALAVLATTRNAGFAGAAMFIATALLAGFVDQNWTGAFGSLGVGAVVLVKARIQYGSLCGQPRRNSERRE